MKTRRRKDKYVLPNSFSKVLKGVLHGPAADYALREISVSDLVKIHKEANYQVVLGVPFYFVARDPEILLWPVPDKNYEIKFVTLPHPEIQ